MKEPFDGAQQVPVASWSPRNRLGGFDLNAKEE
jgi:hypothetical protein